MVLSKLTQVPVMLWQQELAPAICCFSAWGTRPTGAGRLLLARPVPCWLLAGLNTARVCCGCLLGMLVWISLCLEECQLRDLLFEAAQNCGYCFSSRPRDVIFVPFSVCCPTWQLLYFACAQESTFPSIQPGMEKASQMTRTPRLIRKTPPTSTALQYRCILSELANQVEFISSVQVIRRFCC